MADVIRSFSEDAFVWDENKAIANWKKHKVTFDTAISVFYDRSAVILPDIKHSDGEERKIIIGTVLDVISHVKLLFVVFIERVREDNPEGRVYRIISARDATKREARIYERGLPG